MDLGPVRQAERQAGQLVSCGSVSRGQRPRQLFQLQSKLHFADSVFLLFTSRPSISASSYLSRSRLCISFETKWHAFPVPLLSFPVLLLKCRLPPFSPSLCSRATTQLKWFAAAKKISLSLSLLLSLPAPPAPSFPLLMLSKVPPSYCLCLNSAPFVLFPELVLKHRKCSNRTGFLFPKQRWTQKS